MVEVFDDLVAVAFPLTASSVANTVGTVFFSAPLYRPNLHYQVLSKPSSAKTAIEKIGKWIQDNHPYVAESDQAAAI